MNPLSEKSKVLQERNIFQSKWIDLVEMEFIDDEGKLRQWECVHRKNKVDAAIIVAQMQASGRYILIRQFRPPAQSYVLEFPAGLIDPGETPEETALRELKEETGYTGVVLQSTPRLFSSPGLLSEACNFVFVQVDETLSCNQNPQPQNEPGEHIQVLLVRPKAIPQLIQETLNSKDELDIKLFSFFQNIFIGKNEM